MNTKLHQLLLCLCMCFFLYTTSAEAGNRNSSRDSILLEGSIYNNKDEVRNAEIRIYINNVLYKLVRVTSSNQFKTNLPINEMLTIEIAAPGFHEKRFMFDSHVPENNKRRLRYEFDMDIYSESEMEGVNTSLLDFPVGLVSYDEKKKEFIHDKKYTKQMKKEYFRLLEQAKLSERSSMDEE